MCQYDVLDLLTDGVLLGTVKSNSLASALFDLYLGDNPVCTKARVSHAKVRAIREVRRARR